MGPKDQICNKSTRQPRQTGFWVPKIGRTSDKKPKMASKLKRCVRVPWTALEQHLTLSLCTVTPLHGRKTWELTATSGCRSHTRGRLWGRAAVVAATAAAAQKWGKLPYSWAGSEVCSFDCCISPQHRQFSSPKTQARNVHNLQAAVLLHSFGFAAKGKHIYKWKSKETSLFLPYGCLYWKPKGETLCSIEARLVLMRLIQLPHTTTADYHWLQRKLNQAPTMHMVTRNSKPLANTVSNHHPCFQISSLYKHFVFKFPVLLNSTYRTAELTRDIYLHDIYLQKISQAI